MEGKVKILIFGNTPPCAKCLQAEKEARQAASQFSSDHVTVQKHDAFSVIGQRYSVNMTPTTIVNDKKVSVGKVLKEAVLVEIIRNELGV